MNKPRLFVPICLPPLENEFAERDGHIAGGAFEAVGARFQLVRVVLRMIGDSRECRLDLRVQTLGGGFGLAFSARYGQRSLRC